MSTKVSYSRNVLKGILICQCQKLGWIWVKEDVSSVQAFVTCQPDTISLSMEYIYFLISIQFYILI